MKRFLIVLSLICFMYNSYSQNKGSISNDDIKKIRDTFVKDAHTKTAMNALSNNEDIKKVVLNRENSGTYDHYFKYKVKVSGITDQKKSGRCWMFTSMNVLRPKVMSKLNVSNFEFSQNYLFFWDQFEKANLFLENVIKYADKPMDDKYNEWLFKNPIGDGGVWNSFTNLAEKYGLVPKDIMPETANSSNTRWMSRILTRKLREQGLKLREMAAGKSNEKKLREEKLKMMQDIYRIIAINLGEPPAEFNWRYEDKDGKLSELKTYTPVSFMKEVVGEINFDDYVLLMNDPTRPYHKLYEIEYDRNVLEGKNWKYINLPNNEIKAFALESIKNNEAMYASCDVGKQLDTDAGLLDIDNFDFESLYGVKFGMSKKQRIQTWESGSSHGMALVAVDVDKDEKPVKWQFENSWGSQSGHNGYLTFTDKWFNQYMFRVVVLKKFVDEKTLKILKDKPTMLPPWDPMFCFDE